MLIYEMSLINFTLSTYITTSAEPIYSATIASSCFSLRCQLHAVMIYGKGPRMHSLWYYVLLALLLSNNKCKTWKYSFQMQSNLAIFWSLTHSTQESVIKKCEQTNRVVQQDPYFHYYNLLFQKVDYQFIAIMSSFV